MFRNAQGNKGFKYFVGSDGRDRTYDQLINSQPLSDEQNCGCLKLAV